MRKRTAVRNTYPKEKIDTSQPAVPETVSVALAELAGEMREGLLALAVGAGLQVMAAIMEEDVSVAYGHKGRHDLGRAVTWHGHGPGSVTLGGRRVPVTRPRTCPGWTWWHCRVVALGIDIDSHLAPLVAV